MVRGSVLMLLLWSSSSRLSSSQLDIFSGISRLFEAGKGNQLQHVDDKEGYNQYRKNEEACLPYLSELTRIFWGNCKQQAEARTWITWSKTIQNAFDSGQITLENAVKETCRLTAERDTCEEMGKRLSSCDILGAIRAVIQSSQAKQRCDKVQGFIFQPQNGLQNAGQLVGTEIVGGLLRKFLLGQ